MTGPTPGEVGPGQPAPIRASVHRCRRTWGGPREHLSKSSTTAWGADGPRQDLAFGVVEVAVLQPVHERHLEEPLARHESRLLLVPARTKVHAQAVLLHEARHRRVAEQRRMGRKNSGC